MRVFLFDSHQHVHYRVFTFASYIVAVIITVMLEMQYCMVLFCKVL